MKISHVFESFSISTIIILNVVINRINNFLLDFNLICVLTTNIKCYFLFYLMS